VDHNLIAVSMAPATPAPDGNRSRRRDRSAAVSDHWTSNTAWLSCGCPHLVRRRDARALCAVTRQLPQRYARGAAAVTDLPGLDSGAFESLPPLGLHADSPHPLGTRLPCSDRAAATTHRRQPHTREGCCRLRPPRQRPPRSKPNTCRWFVIPNSGDIQCRPPGVKAFGTAPSCVRGGSTPDS
jgi:hypothetical protein